MVRKIGVLVLLFSLLLFASVALAQEEPVATEEAMDGDMMDDMDMMAMASGLMLPRGMAFDAAGNLYIAEAGAGGDTPAIGPRDQEVMVGLTSQVTMVTPDGESMVVLPELFSMPAFGNLVGASDILITDRAMWVALGEGVTDENMPFEGTIVEALVEYDLETMEPLTIIDVGAFERENNPDGEIIAANPTDFAVGPDGTIYIVDASANTLLSWTADGGLELFGVWPVIDDVSQVPDTVAVGPDGTIYVGFLSGFPFATGSAKIEHWTPEGELVETFEGLTGVVDVHVSADGTLYAVQLAEAFGDTGWVAESGSVVSVTSDGITPVMEGLNYPYGLAEDADGNIWVSVNSAFSEPGTGEVLPVSMGGM